MPGCGAGGSGMAWTFEGLEAVTHTGQLVRAQQQYTPRRESSRRGSISGGAHSRSRRGGPETHNSSSSRVVEDHVVPPFRLVPRQPVYRRRLEPAVLDALMTPCEPMNLRTDAALRTVVARIRGRWGQRLDVDIRGAGGRLWRDWSRVSIANSTRGNAAAFWDAVSTRHTRGTACPRAAAGPHSPQTPTRVPDCVGDRHLEGEAALAAIHPPPKGIHLRWRRFVSVAAGTHVKFGFRG